MTEGGPDFLVVDAVSRHFEEVKAVDQVSLSIGRGEIFALLGSSGCGKSTLLRMLAGFETPSEGRILLEGQRLDQLPPYRRPVNMMFQSYALFPHLSVFDNVAFGMRREGAPRAEVRARTEDALRTVQLEAYGSRRPDQLSGGQQQRVALARCLAKRPKLLLLDEPLGALDRKLRAQTQFELQRIIREVGVTCLIVTHDQEEAMVMADRIAIMDQGRLVQVGRPAEIYETPGSRFAADFVGNINLMEGELSVDEPGHCVVTTPAGAFLVGHGISGNLGMRVCIGVRPEKFALARTATPDQPNQFAGHIIDSGYFGSHSRHRVAIAGRLVVEVQTAHNARHLDPWRPGDAVVVSCAVDAIIVLAA